MFRPIDRAVVVDDDGLGRIGIGAVQMHVRFADGHHFAIGSGLTVMSPPVSGKASTAF